MQQTYCVIDSNYVNLLPTVETLSGFMLHEIVAWWSQICKIVIVIFITK